MSAKGLGGLDNLDPETVLMFAENWHVFAFLGLVLAGAFLAKFGWNGLKSSKKDTSLELSSRLAKVDPADYDFDGNKKPEDEKAASMDDFFANTSRKTELGS